MNIYLVERTDDVNYDQYDSFVVFAESDEEARDCAPYEGKVDWGNQDRLCWAMSREKVIATYKGAGVGVAGEIICKSYNAG